MTTDKPYRDACEKIAGVSGVLWPHDHFRARAIEWLLEKHGGITICKDEWNDEGTEKIVGYHIHWPIDPFGHEEMNCFGETLTEALVAAVDVTEIEASDEQDTNRPITPDRRP